jgi:hypothetical protein
MRTWMVSMTAMIVIGNVCVFAIDPPPAVGFYCCPNHYCANPETFTGKTYNQTDGICYTASPWWPFKSFLMCFCKCAAMNKPKKAADTPWSVNLVKYGGCTKLCTPQPPLCTKCACLRTPTFATVAGAGIPIKNPILFDWACSTGSTAAACGCACVWPCCY